MVCAKKNLQKIASYSASEIQLIGGEIVAIVPVNSYQLDKLIKRSKILKKYLTIKPYLLSQQAEQLARHFGTWPLNFYFVFLIVSLE